jgi:NADH-quinone oxidoreductase subunit J
MNYLFYLSAATAVAAAFMAVTRRRAMHALLYLVVSFLAVAAVFFSLGAAFAGVLEVIVYAGAIVVLFVFVVMVLGLGEGAAAGERMGLGRGAWRGPAILAALLLAELAYAAWRSQGGDTAGAMTGPKDVALVLFGPYLLGVEIASFLLLAGMAGAFHLGSHVRAKGGQP